MPIKGKMNLTLTCISGISRAGPEMETWRRSSEISHMTTASSSTVKI